MVHAASLNILVIGRELESGAIGNGLAACTAGNYLCVDGPETAALLFDEGFCPDLVIADCDIVAASENIAWRRQKADVTMLMVENTSMARAGLQEQIRVAVTGIRCQRAVGAALQ